MISPLVGPTIDATEYQRYRLSDLLGWSDLTLDSLRILPRGDAGYLGFAYFQDGRTEAKELETADLTALRTQIEEQGAELLARWAELRRRVAAEERVPIFVITQLGQVLRGEATRIDAYQLTLRRPDSTFVLTLEQIAQLELDEVAPEEAQPKEPVESRFYPPAPIPTRYFLAPSALPTPKGNAYLQVLGLTTVNLHLGATDHLSISAGTDLGTIALTALTPNVTILVGSANVKWTTQLKPNLAVGGGLFMAGATVRGGGGTANNLGLLGAWGYGVATYGNPEYNLTLGVGWLALRGTGSLRTDWLLLPPPVISLSGTARLTDRLAVVAESWLVRIPDPNAVNTNRLTALVVAPGGRLINNGYVVSGAFGPLLVSNPAGQLEVLTFLPFLDFTYLF